MAAYVIYPTDEQEKFIMAFLQALEISFVKDDEGQLPPHVLAGIEKGREDIKAGRYMTLQEVKKRMPAQ